MSWIRTMVAGVALFAGASAAGAQGAPSTHEGHGKSQGTGGPARGMHARLFEGITLTAAQQQKIDEIHAKHRAQRESQAAQASPNGSSNAPAGERRAKMMEAMDKQYAELRAVLTEEQRAVFDANLSEMKKRRQQMQRPPQRS